MAVERWRERSVAPGAGALLAAVALGASVVYSAYVPLAALTLVLILGLVAVHPRYSIYLLAFALGLNLTVVSRPVHISAPQFLTLAVLGGLFVRRLLIRAPRQRYGRLWAWSGLAFAASTLPSLAVTVAPRHSLVATVQLLFIGALIYATVELFVSGEISIERTCLFVLLGAAVSAVPALLQSSLSIGPASFVRGGLMRAYSTFGQPNAYAHYLAGAVPLAAGLRLARRGPAPLPLLVLIAAALVLTGSRGALVATLLALLMLAALRGAAQGWRGAALALAAAVAVVAGLALLPREFLGSVFTLDDWSTGQRLKALQTAWLGILERPLSGYGAGSFSALVSDIRVPGLVDDIEMPHNMLLDIWFELGLPALLVFCLLVYLYLRTTVRVYRRTGDGLLLGLIGAFVGLVTASLFGTLVVRGIGEFLALVVGMTAGRMRQLEPAPSTAPRPGS